MTISFIGHSNLHNGSDLFESIKNTILQNLNANDDVVFLCGGYGDFDDLCAQVCRSIKESGQNYEIVFVTPYMSVAQQEKINEWIKWGLYDSVIYPPLERVPLKFAITKRNEWMINQSDFIIAYVEHSFGGAYQSLKYAKRKGKQIVNLAG